MSQAEPNCEAVFISLPESLYDDESTDEEKERDVAHLVAETQAGITVRALLQLTLPVTVTWSDSDGQCFWRERLTGPIAEFKIEDEFADSLKLGVAIVEAANGNAPFFVVFTDANGKELRFRLQFGEYPTQ